MTLSRHTSPHGTVMAVSMMKDEAPFLLEWFAHHLAVGFTDILVYTNDCTDGTVEMLQRLEELGLGYHRHNVIPEGAKPQPSAINHAQDEPLVQAADWVLMFDADEFLCINHPSGHLDGMLNDAVALGANGIVITWRIFGSGFVTDWSRDPVTEQYLYAAPPLWRMGWGVKTLFKFDPEYWKLGIHRPNIRNKHLEDGFPDTVKWLNGSGLPMEDYFKFRGWRSIRRTVGYDWAQLNHYAIKSIDSYAIRKFRGNVNNKKDKYNADYWSLQDRNEVRDDRILRHAEKRKQIMDQLLADPVLGPLHDAALERVEARLAEYKQTEAYRDLVASLTTAGQVPITQVQAKPPQARDPLKIAELMSRVEKKNSDRPIEERRTAPSPEFGDMEGSPYLPAPIDLSADVPLQMVPNRDLRLPADPRVFTPEALETVIAGKFQRRHGRHIPAVTTGARRMLDLDDGFGFIAMLAGIAHPDLRIMVQQERGDLVSFGQRIAARNTLDDRVSFANGPASGLAICLRDFRPDTLRLSVAAVAPEVLDGVALNGVMRVLIAQDIQGAPIADDWTMRLTAAGFEMRGDGAANGTAVFQRPDGSA